VSSAGGSGLERIGLLFELVFGFLLLPLIVTTMDAPPLWLGGRFLLWFVVVFLVWRMPPDARSRMIQRMRPTRRIPGGWIGPVSLFLLSLGILAVVFQMIDVWTPPGNIAIGGLPAALLIAFLGTIFVVFPMEVLFRVYFPMRFHGLMGRRSAWVVLLSALLFAWLHIPSCSPDVLVCALVLGGLLALMERAGWPFWGTLALHGLAVWTWVMAPHLILEVLPWKV